MGWAGRLFDARDTFVRLLLLDLSGVCYLVFGAHAGQSPTGPQLVLAAVAFTCVLVLHRRPLVSLLVQTALLAAAIWLIDDPTINVVGASWMLLEVAMWAPRMRTVCRQSRVRPFCSLRTNQRSGSCSRRRLRAPAIAFTRHATGRKQ